MADTPSPNMHNTNTLCVSTPTFLHFYHPPDHVIYLDFSQLILLPGVEAAEYMSQWTQVQCISKYMYNVHGHSPDGTIPRSAC